MAKTKTAGAGAGKEGLKEYLEKIRTISDWFEAQDEIDLEEALAKIREAGALIKASKARLTEVENEFEEIKKGVEE